MSVQHIQHLEVGYMVMAQILMIQTYNLHFSQSQAKQQTLKALEI